MFVGRQINCLSLDVVKPGEELQGLLSLVSNYC